MLEQLVQLAPQRGVREARNLHRLAVVHAPQQLRSITRETVVHQLPCRASFHFVHQVAPQNRLPVANRPHSTLLEVTVLLEPAQAAHLAQVRLQLRPLGEHLANQACGSSPARQLLLQAARVIA